MSLAQELDKCISEDFIPMQVKIRTQEDLTTYLEKCSGQTPIMEGHVCKDITKSRTLGRFRRRYFILYRGVLLYYNYKSQYEKDKGKCLKNSKVIILEDVFLTKPDPPSSYARFSFCLHTPHKFNKREEMLIVPQSRSVRHSWIEKLQAQNPHLVTPAHHSSKKSHSTSFHKQ